ncbi:type II secretion system F family protein [Allostreptomyces psammosilenae]|uniref:Flp pilus assembly protein TadB n=1 Tax=Allostreptomyces psammosilenae TaxID=1892865 RepID=A0A852ZT71_9ACTN|nr:type II secretion protein F [Allostreptomyces psammosilenae]NYI05616.1 Flp pilus assembly protein TadB [Allostreptomyces psammosilenae]
MTTGPTTTPATAATCLLALLLAWQLASHRAGRWRLPEACGTTITPMPRHARPLHRPRPTATSDATPPNLRRTDRARSSLATCAVVTGGAALALALGSWPLAGLLPLGWFTATAAARAARLRATRRRGREAVAALCTTLHAELRAGRLPTQALEHALRKASSTPEGGASPPHRAAALGARDRARLLFAARHGGDIPAELRRAAEAPGGEGLLALAACWSVGELSGAGLAGATDRLGRALRAEQAARQEIQGHLAGPRATVALLAGLPVIGLLLGSAAGAEPLDFLLHTPAGGVCLLAGAALEIAGLRWTAQMARRALEAVAGPESRNTTATRPAKPSRRPARRRPAVPPGPSHRRELAAGGTPRRGLP